MLEVLLALVILVFAGIASLGVYDAAWKTFKKGENVAEQQQAVRFAFDKLVADLQMTGFNYNPDGEDSRPDEQIEAAYDTAIVIRGDFDAQDSAAAATPEGALAGGEFDVVSTGNDEIVVFVLAKPDGSSTDTLTFEADVADEPRDGAVETVSIANVALVQDDPPYTLYRITLDPDTANWTSPLRTPLAENVHSMSLSYLNGFSAQLNSTFDLTATGDDIGGADTATKVDQRASIRRIEIDFTGLTRDPDLLWRDPVDPDPATRPYRKFRLIGDVSPRNVGMVGVPDPPAS